MYHAGYIAFRFIRKAEEQQGCLPHLCKVIMFNPNLICGEKVNNRTAVAGLKEPEKQESFTEVNVSYSTQILPLVFLKSTGL